MEVRAGPSAPLKVAVPAQHDEGEAFAVNDVQSILDRMARMPTEGIHPNTIPKDLPEDSTFSKVVAQWRFGQREWQRKNKGQVEESAVMQPEPDVELFHQLSVSILNHIQKQAAIKYAVQDAGFNIIRRGVQVDLKTDQLKRYLEDLEGVRLAEELVSMFGLHEYKHEIVLREIDRVFGTATTIESEKRQRDNSDASYKQDMIELSLETARGIKDIASKLNSGRDGRSAPKSYGESSTRRQARNGNKPRPTKETSGE